MKVNSEKGQDIVEFALILPLLLVLVIGIIYTGFLFADYLTLSNMARSSAREASMSTTTDNYSDIQETYVKQAATSQRMYEVKSKDYQIDNVQSENGSKDVRVRIHAKIQDDNALVQAIKGFIPGAETLIDDGFTIQYQMIRENSSS